MPGLNGYDVARRLRADAATASTALIAVTGWGQATDKQAAADAGFDRHLSSRSIPKSFWRRSPRCRRTAASPAGSSDATHRPGDKMTQIRRHRELVRAGATALAACRRQRTARSRRRLAANSLADLTLEQLGNIEITSVTGRPERAQDAAASIFVITGDDIRRSAATSLPEALRLAPNLQVARLNAGQYAISARGFNNAIGNKLLVLIDGRTVYSPLFSGVFWDAQDVVLADIERIEVISGAGRDAVGRQRRQRRDQRHHAHCRRDAGRRTRSPAPAAKGGEATAQLGGALGDAGHYRAYVTRLQRDNTELVSGAERADASSKNQLGFRTDWTLAGDRITLQGDAYHAGSTSASNLSPVLAGANLRRALEPRSSPTAANWQLQAYYDRSSRADDILFRVKTTHLGPPVQPRARGRRRPQADLGRRLPPRAQRGRPDADAVRRRPCARCNGRTCSRRTRSASPSRCASPSAPSSRPTSTPALEVLPTLRAAYKLGEAHTLWASASRAVRAPARIDRDFFFPATPPFVIKGGPDFESEVANVYELGYRAQPSAATGLLDHRLPPRLPQAARRHAGADLHREPRRRQHRGHSRPGAASTRRRSGA